MKIAFFSALSLLSLLSHPVGASPTISLPRIASQVFRVRRFGAVGDGHTLDTAAFDRAISAARQAGGGVVEVTPGRYLTMPFSLASGIDLKIDRGATVLFSADRATFPKTVQGRYANCLEADGCHDVAITGDGIIDGDGSAWWPAYRRGMPTAPHRPYMVVFSDCTRVLVQGVTLQNSPSFHLVPSGCTDVTIRDIRVHAPPGSPNTDGCDPSGRHFLITGCTFDDGDDCIAVKPGRLQPDGRPSCEDFTISHCIFRHGHGMSIGGQTPGGLDGLTVEDCTFDGTDAGIRMKASRGEGGLVQDVRYRNLRMDHVRVPILITSYYPRIPGDPARDLPQAVVSTTPVWRDIRIDNVTSVNSLDAGQIVGLPEMPVEDITLTNVRISADRGLTIDNARGIVFKDCRITVKSGPAVLPANEQISGIGY